MSGPADWDIEMVKIASNCPFPELPPAHAEEAPLYDIPLPPVMTPPRVDFSPGLFSKLDWERFWERFIWHPLTIFAAGMISWLLFGRTS